MAELHLQRDPQELQPAVQPQSAGRDQDRLQGTARRQTQHRSQSARRQGLPDGQDLYRRRYLLLHRAQMVAAHERGPLAVACVADLHGAHRRAPGGENRDGRRRALGFKKSWAVPDYSIYRLASRNTKLRWKSKFRFCSAVKLPTFITSSVGTPMRCNADS